MHAERTIGPMYWARTGAAGVFCSSITTTKSSASYRPHTTADPICRGPLFCLDELFHVAPPHGKGQCVNGSMSLRLNSKQSTLQRILFFFAALT